MNVKLWTWLYLGWTTLSACTPASTEQTASSPGTEPTTLGPTPATATDPAPVPMVSEVLADCEDPGVFSGLQAGTEFAKHTLDLDRFPEALCNDGTAGELYFRPATTEAGAARWLLELSGGGTCGDGDDCARRWCSVGTSNGSYDMSTSTGPEGATGTGIHEPMPPPPAVNPYADANLVYLRYCSSDFWMGTARDVVLDARHPVTLDPITYRIHFLGQPLLDAMLDTLRRDGVPELEHPTLGPLPDLDDATQVAIGGSMAGGEGLTLQLDRIRTKLEAMNTGGELLVTGILDSAFSPSLELLDFEVSNLCSDALPKEDRMCSYQELIEELRIPIDELYQGIGEDSCFSWHAANAPDTEWQCHDQGHLVRNHVTTPFFVRQGLIDGHRSGHYIDESGFGVDGVAMTLSDFANLTRDQLSALADLPASAEEPGVERAPGVFGPHCARTDILVSTLDTYSTTLTTDSEQRMFDVYTRWQDGLADPIVVSVDPSDSFCP